MIRIHFIALFTSLAFCNVLAPNTLQRPLQSYHDQVLSSPDSDNVHEALLQSKIIPEVIDDFEPAFLFTAQWPGGDEHQANLGNDVQPGDWISTPPYITLAPVAHAEKRCGPNSNLANLTYVVALTDPDAPSRDDPEKSEFCHWVVTGHPEIKPRMHGSDCHTLSIGDLKEVVSYRPPSPPEKTGPHRYVFIVFAHIPPTTGPLDLKKPKRDWGSKGGAKEWARENSLVPVGSNFLYAHDPDQ
ncbi:hypothetical protein MCOR25_009292 [Pyricularia grisea]|uniref:Carboxypeptidase Y inhibitor n=1 Tax=Pyricularia grisea TaxID=148305 RepID=A0A6P8BDQ9_PYRGI|nr:uncharacterized protein PgNI_04117 [Pyricularia grisea]KAI6352798.1 hypothetical protein MCOR25_009292 [Pyricularia grisea]TLD13970.1 hypothetical protein PgNI_04117 [Pyricularia grisea]